MSKAKAYPSAPSCSPLYFRLLALPTKNKLGRKGQGQTLAYHKYSLIMTAKSFVILAPGVSVIIFFISLDQRFPINSKSNEDSTSIILIL